MTLLQVSWFIDYVPIWLGRVLALLGIALLILGMSINDLKTNSIRRRPIRVTVHMTAVSIFGASFTYAAYQTNAALTTIFVLMTARYMEGLVAIRLYQKVVYVLRNRSLPNTADLSLNRRLLLHFLGYFLLLVLGWGIVFAVLWGPIDVGIGWTIRFYWTLGVMVMSILGLTIKFWAASDNIGTITVIGSVLLIVGVELHNLRGLHLELVAYLLAVLSYSAGFWYAVYQFLADKPEQEQQLHPMLR